MTTVLSPRVRVDDPDGGPARLHVETNRHAMVLWLDATPPRLLLGLVLGARARPVDVSIQPRLLAAVLDDDDDRRATAGWLSDLCRRRGLWASPTLDPVRAAGGASFPLLGRVYDEGASTLGEVPRWASPALRATSLRAAALEAFGAAVNRPVVAALAASLAPADAAATPPRLLPLALAVMGAPVLTADGVARVLRAAADASRPSGVWPTVDDVNRFRGLAPRLGPARTTRLLLDASSLPQGVPLLLHTAVLLEGVPAGTWHRLPTGLAALHERVQALTPIDLRPEPVAVAPVRPPAPTYHLPARVRPARPVASRAAPAPVPPRPLASVPRRALAAPQVTAPAPAGHAQLRYPPAVWALHGQSLDVRLRLVLPRSAVELRRWGAQLHSCIDTFGAAVASGRSLLIGIERDDVLTYCAEVTPASGTVRQLHGSHNRPVPRPVAAALGARLLADGILDRDLPENRRWVALATAGP